VTAKERLLRDVLDLDEAKAARARIVVVEDEGDTVTRLFDSAPLEDEEISAEEEAAVQEARDDLAAGEPTVPLAEIKRKYGLR
jgi:hypothetical protein